MSHFPPRQVRLLLGIHVILMLAAHSASADDPPLRWWKGNLHTHTFWSDGNDFPEMVADWYREHGYHFLALSDHNILSEGMRWMRFDEIVRRGGDEALTKYRQRFGDAWVETRGQPNAPDWLIRLKPLDEYRALVEERGRFLMIPGEEISDQVSGKPIHLNATNLKELIRPLGGASVVQAIENNLRAVEEQADKTGREILLHVNHPNFGYAISAEQLAAVTAERFYEIYNGHPVVNHLGDETHPGVERMWDLANAIRLGRLDAAPLLGLATDDSHSYHGRPGARPGRGWIMVRAQYLTPEHLIKAIKAGQFYASSGVTLEQVEFEPSAQRLRVKIQPREGVRYTTEFIGTRRGYEGPDQIGQVLARVEGVGAEYRLTGNELYVRAVVTSSREHPDPSFANQKEQAWTQPVGWSLAARAASGE